MQPCVLSSICFLLPFGNASTGHTTAAAAAFSVPAQLASLMSEDDDFVVYLLSFFGGTDVNTLSVANIVIARIVLAVIFIIITAIVSWLVTRGVKGVLASLNDRVPSTIFVNIARVFVWCIGLAIILSLCFNIDPTGIVAALGVGGIAISLGMQDTISNVIGGLQMSTMDIAKKGDHVQVGNIEGILEDITWRETVIVGFSGERSIVPNKVINSNSLTVLPPARKVKVPIQIPNETIAHFMGQGISSEGMGELIAQSVTKKLKNPAPDGMGLALQSDAFVQFLNVTDFGTSATVVVWIADGEEFDRLAVASCMAATASDICSIGKVDQEAESDKVADIVSV